MRGVFTSLLAATALLVGQVAAAPSIDVRAVNAQGSTPVHPGGVKDIIITKDNTLNATNPTPPGGPSPNAATNSKTLPLALVNNLGAGTNAYVTGLDPNGRIVFVQPNGQFYYPPCDSSYVPPREITANIAIPLGGLGSTKNIVIPDYLSSARVYFAQGNLHFYMVWGGAGPGLVQPSFTNTQDPSAGINWGFVEFTYTAQGGLYANISYVDFVGVPLGMSLTASDGTTQTVKGLKKGSVAAICNALQTQQNKDGQPWGNLCQSYNGQFLRAVALYPYTRGSSDFQNYYADYVNKVWTKYASTPLTINTQTGSGNVNCRTSGNTMTCDGDNRSYAKPSSSDIYGCNDNTFAIQGSDNGVHRAVVPRLCAAFHRSTLLLNGGNVQPSLPATSYYTVNPTNYYNLFVHQHEADGRGYAFSYDDVNPSTGGPDQSGVLVNMNPQVLQISVGGA